MSGYKGEPAAALDHNLFWPHKRHLKLLELQTTVRLEKMLKAITFVVLVVMVAGTEGNLECPTKFDQVATYCLHVSTEYIDSDQTPPPVPTWKEAREKCQGLASPGWTTDLVILKEESKLSSLSKHIYDNYEALRSLVYWVGARQIFGHGTLWVWLDGSNIDYFSNIWLPSEPPIATSNNIAQLVPAGSDHFRLYLQTRERESQAPSFVCEAVKA